MDLARELAILNKQISDISDKCNDIAMMIHMDLDTPIDERKFITKAFIGRGANCKEFKELSTKIKKYKVSEIGTVVNEQESINNIIDLIDFFQKVFREE